MSYIATTATAAMTELLSGQTGVHYRLAQRLVESDGPLSELVSPLIRTGHLSVEMADKAQGAAYPQLFVYCERIQNLLREKFSPFSGTVHVAVEVRHSQDRLERLQERAQLYTEAILDVLESCRGEWRPGYCFGGRYEVKFEPVRHGGKNFVQIVRITVPLEVNIG